MTITTAVRDKLDRFSSTVAQIRSERGTPGALAEAARQVVGASRRAVGYTQEAAFDYRHGMYTRGVVKNPEAVRGADGNGDGHFYQATPARTFRSILNASGVDPARTTFLDLGCGRGRAVLLAAQAGFARSIGIDLDPQLCREATRNVRRSRAGRAQRDRRIEIWTGDAADVDLPVEDLLLFLFNPFGEATLQRVLARVSDSAARHPRAVTVCYSNPVHEVALQRNEAFHEQARGRDWTIYACTAARPRPVRV
jgi:predicted RNA methylase